MLATANAKHHNKAFQAPETLNTFKGKWHWQQFHSMKTMNWGFEHGGHEFNKIQSVINTKCQGREGGFLFWSIEPCNLTQQHQLLNLFLMWGKYLFWRDPPTRA